jgi:spermidine synthase
MNSASDQICNSATTNEHKTPNDSSEASCEVREGDNIIQDMQQFYVIIMDALDPQDNVKFADMLYNSDQFFFSLFNALTDDGILIMQLGIAQHLHDLPFEFTGDKTKINFVIELSEQYGFESLHAYEESNYGFLSEWTFMLAGKNSS